MKRTILSMQVVVGLLVAANAATAASINIDFGPTSNHPSGTTSVLYSGTAAAPDSGTVWNELIVADNNAFHGPPGEFGFWNTSVSLSNLLSSQGIATSIGVTAVGTNDTGTFGIVSTATNNLNSVASDAVNLMRDYLIGFNAPQEVKLTGFAPGTVVDLYLYGAGDTDNRDTLFSVTDVNGAHSATTTGTLTGDVNSPVAHVLTLGGDYVVLPGIVASASGAISIFYDNGAGSGEAPFNGLQAVFSPIPEPATFVLVGLAGFGLIGVRRRR